jgi:hypothetical protein
LAARKTLIANPVLERDVIIDDAERKKIGIS